MKKISRHAAMAAFSLACFFASDNCAFANPQKSGLKYYPAKSAAEPSGCLPANLPTGAREFEVLQPAPKSGVVVNAADFGLNENVENAATIINRALAHCAKIGAAKLVVERGTYKCFDAVSITLENFEDFTLDFNGSKLVYYSKCLKSENPNPAWNTKKNESNCNLKIKNCRRLKVCNVQFDWDWERDPLGGFAKVAAKNADAPKPYVDLQFWQYEKYPLFGKYASVVSVASFLDDLSGFHPQRVGLFFPAPEPIHLAEGYYTSETSWVSPNVMRLYVDKNRVSGMVLGGTYRVMHYYVGKNCIDMYSNRHLTLENIDILSCRGHALHVDDGQKYWQYINVNVAPPADDPRRAVSSTADHNHIANSCGYMKILNSTFSMGQDDGANIHDRSFFMKRVGEKTLESANLRGLDYFSPQIGDELSLMQDDFRPTGYVGKILKIGGGRVELDKALPTQEGEGFVCFNKKYSTRNIIIRNCKYVRHGCRGLLLPAKDVTVENCLFEREQMGAIKCESGYTKSLWCEGYGVDNVVVRNCVFRKCNMRGLKNQGFVRDVMLAAYMRTDPSDEQPAVSIIKNLLFEDNKFFDTRGLVAVISASENVVFRRNVIENDYDYGDDLWYRGGFFVRNSSNVHIVDNTFVHSSKVPFAGVYADDTAKNLNVGGNRIISKK